VGGFGSSAYLRNKLQHVFGESMGELLSPPFAYSAVVEGAVRFLQSPATIVARVSSLTYCVQVSRGAGSAVCCAVEWSVHGWHNVCCGMTCGGMPAAPVPPSALPLPA
jgi:hypothetical protein